MRIWGKSSILRFAAKLHKLNIACCLVLLVIVFCSQCMVVLMRYLFSIGFIELQNLVSYSFAMLCVLAIPVALRTDQHVRVDIFRSRQTTPIMRLSDVIGIIIFLAPVFLTTLWFAMPLVSYSWSILEGSRETGGLPGFFIVLTALPISCVLILIQSIAIALDNQLIHTQEEDQ